MWITVNGFPPRQVDSEVCSVHKVNLRIDELRNKRLLMTKNRYSRQLTRTIRARITGSYAKTIIRRF